MFKKLLISVVCLLVVCSCVLGLVACNNDGDAATPAKKLIVYTIGDSIAEALAGPSPLSERENYGYYALLGKGNDYYYVNRAVSGYKTDQMLVWLNREASESPIDYSLLKNADVIQLSILGNDLLQDNLGGLLAKLATYISEVKEIEGNQNMTLKDFVDYVHEHIKDEDSGGSHAIDYIKGRILTDTGKNITESDMTFSGNCTSNIAKIVARIKEVNPTATLLVQTIYNPVFDTSCLVTDIPAEYKDENGNYVVNPGTGANDLKSVRQRLSELGYDSSTYRDLGDILIEMLNNVVRDYLVENPGAYTIVEVHDAFDAYYEADSTVDKIYARRLFSQDYIHPSNEGHAMIADLTQKILEEKGLANKDSYIASTKAIRCDQIDRLYSYEACPVDTTAAKTAINAATTAEEVNLAYFNAITSSGYADEVAGRDATKQQSFYPWVEANYAGQFNA